MDSIKGKKILFVITKSNWGGAQAYVYTLATRYKLAGADVVVALGGTGEPGAPIGLLGEKLQQADIRTILLSTFARDVSLPRELSAFFELRKVIRDTKPDTVHLNSSKAGGLGALAARCEHVKNVVFTAHGWAFREPRPFLSKLLIRISSWLTIFLCNKVIVVSQLDYNTSPVLFSHKKMVTVRNGISQFELASKEQARNELLKYGNGTLREFPIWILIQSELHKNKGIDIAIRAFDAIAKSRTDCVLIVIGEGEERNRLEKIIHELQLDTRVFLLGFVPNSRTYLHAASIFLLPSRKEGLPLTLLEAGVAGLPSIATRVGGVPEVLSDGENGLLIDPENIMALRNAIQKHLSDMHAAIAMGSALQQKIETEFSEDRMISETIRAYLS